MVKQLSKSELSSFVEGGEGPAYFKYLATRLGQSTPTCLSKILGLYQASPPVTR